MEHRDEELSDIEIVFEDEAGMTIDQCAAQLKDQGVAISNVDQENCIVEGTINAAKVSGLKTLNFVKYVRVVFTYIADYPEGDPRNLDKDDDCLPTDPD
jgi:hypothetical protein